MQFRTPSKNNTISNKDIEKEFKNLRKELLDLQETEISVSLTNHL